MTAKITKTARLKNRAFRDVDRKPPERIAVVRAKHGEAAAHRMQVAISLDRARSRGARIPRPR